MVAIEEIVEKDELLPPSEERRLDAEEIEKVSKSMTRPTARMHMESLAKKLRKESEALKRVEKSQKQQLEQQQQKQEEEQQQTESSSPVSESAATSTTTTTTPTPETAESTKKTVSPTSVVASTPTTPTPSRESGKFVSIDRFSFDFGDYNSAFVSLYVALPGVGSISRDNVRCKFTSSSFDFVVENLNGKSYRLYKDNLEKDIVPEKCKTVVKANKVILKLAKVRGEYGSYDYWTQLTAKKSRKEADKAKNNPQASIMDMMKDMYESGDDNMKKMIAETMIKQRNGELDNNAKDYGKGLSGMGGDDF